MARTHGKILCSIWENADFIGLPIDAQRLYMALLSQPKLNLVGALDYNPRRLARLCDGTAPHDIDTTITLLETFGFVVVDRATEELHIRSFTRNDPIQINNSKLRKGLWSAWLSIESTALRTTAIDNMPTALFDFDDVPLAAMRIRTSERMEGAPDPATDHPMPIAQSERAMERPTDTPPPPPPPPPPPAASASGRPHPTPVDKSEPPAPQPPPVETILADRPDPDFALGLAAIGALKDRHRPTAHDDDPAEHEEHAPT